MHAGEAWGGRGRHRHSHSGGPQSHRPHPQAAEDLSNVDYNNALLFSVSEWALQCKLEQIDIKDDIETVIEYRKM